MGRSQSARERKRPVAQLLWRVRGPLSFIFSNTRATYALSKLHSSHHFMPGTSTAGRKRLRGLLEDAYQSTKQPSQPATRTEALKARLYPQPSFRPYYTPQCNPSLNHNLAITESDKHLLHERVRRKIFTRDKDTLWISYAVPLKIHPKSVVRHWCKNRLKEAVKEALREFNFDHEGRPLRSDSSNESFKAQRGLKGSLMLSAHRNAVTRTWPDLKEDARKLVYGLRKQQTSNAELAPRKTH